MKVIVKDHVYGMTRKKLNSVLKIASNQIPFGIYAIEKGGICELRKDTFDNIGELGKAVQEYKAKGFKVIYNEKRK